MKKIKEDWNYAAGVATGIENGSNKPVKPKKKYKFKTDSASLSGMGRSYYEEDKMEKISVSKVLKSFLEEIEQDKKDSQIDVEQLKKDYRTIIDSARAAIKDISLSGRPNTTFLRDIVSLINLNYKDLNLREGVANTDLGASRSIDSAQPAEEETQDGLSDTGGNNRT